MENFYKFCCKRGATLGVYASHMLTYYFKYCDTMGTLRASEGWTRVTISMALNTSRPWTNSTGCFPCPLQLLTKLFRDVGGLPALIPFNSKFSVKRRRVYATPWDTRVYESYCNGTSHGHAVLLDLYSDGATLSKSETQSALFYRIPFANLRSYCNYW